MNKVLLKLDIKIDIEVDIGDVKRFGQFKEDRIRPILTQARKDNKKMLILNNAKHLKGKNIWIDNDYSKKAQKKRKALIGQMKEARQKGYYDEAFNLREVTRRRLT
ncbi:hypothetical protein ILUMI_08362 [Ignelater luminosus]|uniref:Uncharacterized protein n=1 Tax=Ignelater luminosus TaxID=2038154 RepID=A0A8K0D709_IGNLU|nr:hypothetical protein ILUMI_08362 [Ignelater luminosus]